MRRARAQWAWSFWLFRKLGMLVTTTLGTGPRILVVDDEETVLLTIRGVLELDGYEVVSASTGAKALELLRGQRFDLILTDLRLRDLDGVALLHEHRQQAPDAAAIMLTGYASLESAVQALREGAYDYLIKPCNVVELRTTVSRALERGRLAHQLRQQVTQLEAANERIRVLNHDLERRVEDATAELRAQLSVRDEFTAAVSHDLKSPLTFIKGLANLRRRRAAETPETRPLIEALAQIEASAGRMAQQLDSLVDASRLEAGRPLELRREPTDLVALAGQAIAEHQQTTDQHRIELHVPYPSVIGVWDGVRLCRVLDNLLGNAIKYSPRGGGIDVVIEVEGEPQERWAILRVRDHGEGIPETDLPHIFERFRRGRNVEGRIPGTGIGLAGARRILEQHGGSIDVDSHVGEGTTFCVRLPMTATV
jgi:signal transduction histidine kinase